MEETNDLKTIKRNQYIIMVLISIVIVILLMIGSSGNKDNRDGTWKYNTSQNNNQTQNGNQSQDNNGTQSQINTEYDVSSFKEISATQLENESKSSTKVVYIGRSSCGYCTAFLPDIKQAQEEYNYQTLYIDIAKIIDFTSSEFKILDQEGYDSIMNLSTTDEYKGYLEENFGATPMIMILKNKKVIGIEIGYVEYSELKSFLNSHGIK